MESKSTSAVFCESLWGPNHIWYLNLPWKIWFQNSNDAFAYLKSIYSEMFVCSLGGLFDLRFRFIVSRDIRTATLLQMESKITSAVFVSLSEDLTTSDIWIFLSNFEIHLGIQNCLFVCLFDLGCRMNVKALQLFFVSLSEDPTTSDIWILIFS